MKIEMSCDELLAVYYGELSGQKAKQNELANRRQLGNDILNHPTAESADRNQTKETFISGANEMI